MHRGFRNLYVEELKYNLPLVNEFKEYLKSHRVSGKFALINGYMEYHWGSGRTKIVQDCDWKPSKK